MNQIDYTLIIRRWSLVVCLLGLGIFGYILFFLDPTDSTVFVWALLLSLTIWLAAAINLGAIWFFFHSQKKILSIAQTNNLLYQSIVTSATVTLILVLQVTGFFNTFSMLLVALCYGFYQVYANSGRKLSK